MRRIPTLLVLVAVTTLLAAGVAFTQTTEEDTDPYIVVLEESVDSPSFVANGIEGRQDGLEVGYVYSEALEGFSAEIPDDSLDEVRNNPNVAYVEPDRVVTTLEQTLPWGINRIDADESPTAKAGDGKGAVSDVRVYVIDTGIDKNRADLNVTQHLNFHGGPNTDCDGHGTHVAGTLAAKDNNIAVVGVAPGAPLIGVKVLGCRGFGMASTVVEGIDWVTQHAIEGPDGRAGTADDSKPAVANMSLGDDSVITFVDQAVRESARKGVFYSIAAGNDGRDACNVSPARAGAGTNNGILTTAATTKSNEEPRWSNSGPCVDLWAPGVSIESTKLGSGTRKRTGTSMSAPHAGGAGALYFAANPTVSPERVERRLEARSELTGTQSRTGRKIRLVNAAAF